MSYQIYCIAYRITDEIRAKKEAEKPFWWEHLHQEVKDKSIEDVEKLLIEGGISQEDLKKMTKHEKYLAVSEGCYVIDCKESEKELAQLESLKKEVERSKTSFLGTQNNNHYNDKNTEDFKPFEFGKIGGIDKKTDNVISAIPPIDPMVKNIDDNIFESSSKSPLDVDDEHIKILSENVNDNDLLEDSSKSSPIIDIGSNSSVGSKPELKKFAQNIVRQTVSQINSKADEIPDDVALLKEQELLQAVINELQSLK